ncbi:MAG: CRTAC1 family protein, partial [Gemmatimonadota bacterium]
MVRLPPALVGHYRVEFDGRFVRRWELGEPDELYLNDGEGRFTSVSFTGGRFVDEGGRPLVEPPRDWGLSVRFHDWDRDGDPDLYVANDFTSPDGVWLNDGTGTFHAIPTLALRTTSLSSMAVAFTDLERDGDVDIVTTDMLARDPVRALTQVPTFVPTPDAPGEIETRHQVNRNTLQLARGDGTFAEAAYRAGVAASDWTWGALFLDVELDGYEDLLVTTGHVWDQLDVDTHIRLRATPGAVDWRRELAAFPPLRQPNAAFRNRGDGTFEDVTRAWGFGLEDDISHGIAPADLDGDGDLDVVVTRFGDPPALYRNEARRPRVAVRLIGEPPNTAGIGAVVRLRGGPAGEQTKEVTAGGLYLSSGDGSVTFAASEGGTADAMELEVEWPDGRTSRVTGVRANRLYEVRQRRAAVHEPRQREPGVREPGS